MGGKSVSAKAKQPNPIDKGWKENKGLVHTHIMNNSNTCLTHENCHPDSFYPGKLYRNMKIKRNKDGYPVIDKEK